MFILFWKNNLNITENMVNRNMDIVRPIRIPSPISGEMSQPKISERQYGDKIYVEAVWIDPKSGVFIRKGTVKILDAATRQDITHQCH